MNDHDAIDLLEDLVRIPSVSRDEAAAAAWLVEPEARSVEKRRVSTPLGSSAING